MEDPNSIEARRKRAYTWCFRFSFPEYEHFKKCVRAGQCMDITEADVDLLPWRNGRLNKAEWQKMRTMKASVQIDIRKPMPATNHETEGGGDDAGKAHDRKDRVQKVYETYKKLANPSYDTMLKALAETTGLAITKDDIELLPWSKDKTKVIEDELGGSIQKENDITDASVYRYPPDASWDEAMENRAKHAYDRFVQLGRPCRHTYRRILEETTGLGVAKEDIDLLPWNEDRTVVLDFEAERKRREEQLRVQADQDERYRRKQIAYDLYKSLANPSLDTMMKALTETTGLAISREDVGLLPWDNDGTKVIEDELGEGIARKEDLVDDSQYKYPPDESWDKAMENRAQKAFDTFVQLGRPSRHTYRRILEETTGLGVAKEDIDLLPWNEDRTVVLDFEAQQKRREEKLRVQAEQDERCRRKQIAYDLYKSLANPTLDTMMKALTETTGLAISKEDVGLLPWDNDGTKVIEDELGKGIARKEDLVDDSQYKYPPDESWDKAMENRAQKAFDTFVQLGRPCRHTYRRILEETTGLGVAKEDIDLLPWNEDRTVVLDFEAERKRREEKLRVQAEQDDRCLRKQKAYDLYKSLANASCDTLMKALTETTGLAISKEDVGLLPWNNDGTKVIEDELGEGIARKEDLVDDSQYKYPPDESWDKAMENRAQKAFDTFVQLGRPCRHTYRRILEETTGLGVAKEDIDLLPWNEDRTVVLDFEAERKRREEKLRVHAEEDERCRRKQIAYDLYKSLANPTLDTVMKALTETTGLGISKEDVGLLPWDNDGTKVIEDELGEGIARKEDLVDDSQYKYPPDESWDKAMENRAQKAFDTFVQLGRPCRHTYRRILEETTGLGVAKEDIDLLPWNEDRTVVLDFETERKRREEKLRLQAEQHERCRRKQIAYDLYKSLANPTLDTLMKALTETTGLGMSKEDVGLLPWDNDGTKVIEDELGEGIARKEDLVDDSQYKYPPDESWDKAMENRAQHAFDTFVQLGRPCRHTYRRILEETTGLGVAKEDIDLLPWNEDRTVVLDFETERKRREEKLRVQAEQHERCRRKQIAYDLYKSLANPTLDTMMKALTETTGLGISKEDVGLLPWDNEGTKVIEDELGEGIARKEDLVDDSQYKYPPDESWDKATENRAQKAFDTFVQLGRPCRHTYRRILEETTGLGVAKEDIDLLPWNEDRTVVLDFEAERKRREEKLRVHAEEDERCRRKQIAYDLYKSLANASCDTLMKALTETTGLGISKEDVGLLPWDNDGTKVIEDELGEGIARKEDLVDDSQYKYPPDESWDKAMEKRAQKAFDTFVQLGRPCRHTYRRILEETTGLGVAKEDIDLLPWNEDRTVVLDFEAERKRREEKLRVHAEEDERCRRQQKAYDLYKSLANASRDTLMKALTETTGLGISKEDVGLLPWDNEGTKVIEYELGEGIARKEDLVDDSQYKYPLDKSWDKAMENRARKAFDTFVQLGRPCRHTYRRILEETTGLGVAKEDIDLLPWNEDRTVVLDFEAERKRREEKLRVQAEQDERCRRQQKAYDLYKSLANASRDTMMKALTETTGLGMSKEDVDLLPWDNEGTKVIEDELGEGFARKEDLVDDSQYKYPPDESWDKAMENRAQKAFDTFVQLGRPCRHTYRRILEETTGLGVAKEDIDLLTWNRELTGVLDLNRERERRAAAAKLVPVAKESAKDHFAEPRMVLDEPPTDLIRKEDLRIIRAYRWYQRLGMPNKRDLKSRIELIVSCDVEPVDVDLLPWIGQTMVSVPKMNKVLARNEAAAAND